jgi:hypothetical protein
MAWQGFEVFRRRQKVILAALAVLAMGLFIVGDVLIGVRMGHYGLGYGLRSWFYDTRLEELLTLHDHRVAAMRALFAAHHRARERWLLSRFQVADPKDIKDENLRKEYDLGTLQATRTWLGQLYQGLTLFGLAGDTFPLDAEGLLQFAYWKAEANRLGVVVAPEILRSDFERFTFNQLDDRELLNIVHRELRLAVSQEQLFTWWGDEIRAALARKVSCGTNPQRVVPPTLLDLWEAYRDLGTRLPQVAVITLNVHEDRFAKAVPEPSEEELRKYFDQHKQREPDPLQAEPGFRVPTRYRVEFIYADVRYDPNDPARTGEACLRGSRAQLAALRLSTLLGGERFAVPIERATDELRFDRNAGRPTSAPSRDFAARYGALVSAGCCRDGTSDASGRPRSGSPD